MTALTEAFKTVNDATQARDLFNGDKDKTLRTYRSLAKVLHPDHVPAASLPEANAAFAKLSTLWDAYQAGDSGKPLTSVVISTRKRAYVVGDTLAQGDIAVLYSAKYLDDGVTADAVVKMPRSAKNNDLMQTEAKVLRHLADHADPVGLPYLPVLIDSFRHKDTASGTERTINVLNHLDGFYTLAEVKDAFPSGLDIRDVLWMWKRLLIGIGHAHKAGVVHGAILPEHVLIHPEKHGLCIVDWCYASVDPFGPLKAIVPTSNSFYPKAVLDKGNLSPQTDVTMATNTIATLFDAAIPIRFSRFAKACVASPPEDAWGLMNELTELAEEHFPRRFREFAMPMKT